MLRSNRIKEYNFSLGSLTAPSAGSFTVFSDHVINGTIQSITLYPNTFTTTGSLLVFASGLANSGVGLGDLIITLRAGSTGTFYPVVYPAINQSIILSGTTVAMSVQPIINSILRIVGSTVGDTTSGLGLSVRYI